MSILGALQEYLTGFDRMELRPITEVLTDRPEPGFRSSYAIAPSGGSSRLDVTGGREFTNSYTFYALERNDAEADRAENWDFLEALTAWLDEKASLGEYPELPEPYQVGALEVANAMLLDLDDSGAGIYQVQIQLTFYKE